jgi:hypothetical protein
MIHANYLLLTSAVFFGACTHQAPMSPAPQTEHRITLHEEGMPVPAGTRFAIQFNNEPPVIQVADGRGGPPILYHGQEVPPDRFKSIIVLKTKEARERFGDQTLDAAILIELR